MQSRFHKISRVIAGILIVTFLAQDIVWANPSANNRNLAVTGLQNKGTIQNMKAAMTALSDVRKNKPNSANLEIEAPRDLKPRDPLYVRIINAVKRWVRNRRTLPGSREEGITAAKKQLMKIDFRKGDYYFTLGDIDHLNNRNKIYSKGLISVLGNPSDTDVLFSRHSIFRELLSELNEVSARQGIKLFRYQSGDEFLFQILIDDMNSVREKLNILRDEFRTRFENRYAVARVMNLTEEEQKLLYDDENVLAVVRYAGGYNILLNKGDAPLNFQLEALNLKMSHKLASHKFNEGIIPPFTVSIGSISAKSVIKTLEESDGMKRLDDKGRLKKEYLDEACSWGMRVSNDMLRAAKKWRNTIHISDAIEPENLHKPIRVGREEEAVKGYEAIAGFYDQETFRKKVKENLILLEVSTYNGKPLRDEGGFHAVNTALGSDNANEVIGIIAQETEKIFREMGLKDSIFCRGPPDRFSITTDYPINEELLTIILKELQVRIQERFKKRFNSRFPFDVRLKMSAVSSAELDRPDTEEFNNIFRAVETIAKLEKALEMTSLVQVEDAVTKREVGNAGEIRVYSYEKRRSLQKAYWLIQEKEMDEAIDASEHGNTTPESLTPESIRSRVNLRNPDDIESLYCDVYATRRLEGDIIRLLKHIRRGRAVAEKLGEKLNLNEKDMATLSLAFSLHDLGKMYNSKLWGIIVSARSVPRDPEDPERKLINNHASYSIDIIKELGLDVPADVVELIKYHHNPQALKDERLRMLGEIIHWADIADAMIAFRPYQNGEWNTNSRRDILTLLENEGDRAFSSNRCIHKETYALLRQLFFGDVFFSLYPELPQSLLYNGTKTSLLQKIRARLRGTLPLSSLSPMRASVIRLKDIKGSAVDGFIEGVLGVYDEVFSKGYATESYLKALLKKDGRELFAAVVNGKVAGCASLEYYQSGDMAIIDFMGVRSELRHKGIGEAILGQIEKFARERSLKCLIFEDTNSSYGFYKRYADKKGLYYDRVPGLSHIYFDKPSLPLRLEKPSPNLENPGSASQAEDTEDITDDVSPTIRAHIKKGIAVELRLKAEKGKRVVKINKRHFGAENMRLLRPPPEEYCRPIEDYFESKGIFDKIERIKEPARLRRIVSKENFRNFSPEEKEELLRIAQDISISFILSEVIVGKGKIGNIVAHARTGLNKPWHHLEPTVWIGEVLFNRCDDEQLAQLLLEEAQHVLWPETDHGNIDNAKDPRKVIEHDRIWKASIDDMPATRKELAECAPLPASEPPPAVVETKTRELLLHKDGAPNAEKRKEIDAASAKRLKKLADACNEYESRRRIAPVLGVLASRAVRLYGSYEKLIERFKTDPAEAIDSSKDLIEYLLEQRFFAKDRPRFSNMDKSVPVETFFSKLEAAKAAIAKAGNNAEAIRKLMVELIAFLEIFIEADEAYSRGERRVYRETRGRLDVSALRQTEPPDGVEALMRNEIQALIDDEDFMIDLFYMAECEDDPENPVFGSLLESLLTEENRIRLRAKQNAAIDFSALLNLREKLEKTKTEREIEIVYIEALGRDPKKGRSNNSVLKEKGFTGNKFYLLKMEDKWTHTEELRGGTYGSSRATERRYLTDEKLWNVTRFERWDDKDFADYRSLEGKRFYAVDRFRDSHYIKDPEMKKEGRVGPDQYVDPERFHDDKENNDNNSARVREVAHVIAHSKNVPLSISFHCNFGDGKSLPSDERIYKATAIVDHMAASALGKIRGRFDKTLAALDGPRTFVSEQNTAQKLHDLKTPFNVMGGHAQSLMRTTGGNPKLSDIYDRAKEIFEKAGSEDNGQGLYGLMIAYMNMCKELTDAVRDNAATPEQRYAKIKDLRNAILSLENDIGKDFELTKSVVVRLGNLRFLDGITDTMKAQIDIIEKEYFRALKYYRTEEVALKIKPVETAKYIRSCAARFGAAIAEKDVNFELDIIDEESVSDILIDDRLFYDRVLAPILDNAVKYGDKGVHIILTVQGSGGRVLITVSDDGRGISEEGLMRLFGAYERADRTTKGTGLGLHGARQMVESLHDKDGKRGRISVTSQTGDQHGSKFFIDMPAIPRPETRKTDDAKTDQQQALMMRYIYDGLMDILVNKLVINIGGWAEHQIRWLKSADEGAKMLSAGPFERVRELTGNARRIYEDLEKANSIDQDSLNRALESWRSIVSKIDLEYTKVRNEAREKLSKEGFAGFDMFLKQQFDDIVSLSNAIGRLSGCIKKDMDIVELHSLVSEELEKIAITRDFGVEIKGPIRIDWAGGLKIYDRTPSIYYADDAKNKRVIRGRKVRVQASVYVSNCPPDMFGEKYAEFANNYIIAQIYTNALSEPGTDPAKPFPFMEMECVARGGNNYIFEGYIEPQHLGTFKLKARFLVSGRVADRRSLSMKGPQEFYYTQDPRAYPKDNPYGDALIEVVDEEASKGTLSGDANDAFLKEAFAHGSIRNVSLDPEWQKVLDGFKGFLARGIVQRQPGADKNALLYEFIFGTKLVVPQDVEAAGNSEEYAAEVYNNLHEIVRLIKPVFESTPPRIMGYTAPDGMPYQIETERLYSAGHYGFGGDAQGHNTPSIYLPDAYLLRLWNDNPTSAYMLILHELLHLYKAMAEKDNAFPNNLANGTVISLCAKTIPVKFQLLERNLLKERLAYLIKNSLDTADSLKNMPGIKPPKSEGIYRDSVNRLEDIFKNGEGIDDDMYLELADNFYHRLMRHIGSIDGRKTERLWKKWRSSRKKPYEEQIELLQAARASYQAFLSNERKCGRHVPEWMEGENGTMLSELCRILENKFGDTEAYYFETKEGDHGEPGILSEIVDTCENYIKHMGRNISPHRLIVAKINLGKAYERMSRHREAINVYEDAVRLLGKLKPGEYDPMIIKECANLALGSAAYAYSTTPLKDKDYIDLAVKSAEKACSVDSPGEVALMARIEAYEAAGMFDEALKAAISFHNQASRTIISVIYNEGFLQRELGSINLQKGDKGEASENFGQAMKISDMFWKTGEERDDDYLKKQAVKLGATTCGVVSSDGKPNVWMERLGVLKGTEGFYYSALCHLDAADVYNKLKQETEKQAAVEKSLDLFIKFISSIDAANPLQRRDIYEMNIQNRYLGSRMNSFFAGLICEDLLRSESIPDIEQLYEMAAYYFSISPLKAVQEIFIKAAEKARLDMAANTNDETIKRFQFLVKMLIGINYPDTLGHLKSLAAGECFDDEKLTAVRSNLLSSISSYEATLSKREKSLSENIIGSAALAEKMLSRGDIDAALKEADSAAGNFPEKLTEQLIRVRDELSRIRSVVGQIPVLMCEARKLYDTLKINEARQKINDVLRIFPGSSQARSLLENINVLESANAAYVARDDARALESARKLKDVASDVLIHKVRTVTEIESLIEGKNIREAKMRVTALAKKYPQDERIRAIEARVDEICKKSAALVKLMNQAIEKADVPEFMKYFKEVMALDGYNSAAMDSAINMAEACYKKGRYDGAIEAALAIPPTAAGSVSAVKRKLLINAKAMRAKRLLEDAYTIVNAHAEAERNKAARGGAKDLPFETLETSRDVYDRAIVTVRGFGSLKGALHDMARPGSTFAIATADGKKSSGGSFVVLDMDESNGGMVRLELTEEKDQNIIMQSLSRGRGILRYVPNIPVINQWNLLRRIKDRILVNENGVYERNNFPSTGYELIDAALGLHIEKQRHGPESPRVNFIDPKIMEDEDQVAAVKEALDLKKLVSLIHGPPGTGKTTVLVEIARQFVRAGFRVCIVSQSNPGTDRVGEELANAGQPFARVAARGTKVSDVIRESYWNRRGAILAGFRDRWMAGSPGNREGYVVIGTNNGFKLDGFIANDPFFQEYDIVIEDEASRSTVPESLVPAEMAKLKLIKVGDHRQLPPYGIANKEEELIRHEAKLAATKEMAALRPNLDKILSRDNIRKFRRSLFEILYSAKDIPESTVGKVMLKVNRRSKPWIVRLVTIFYGGMILPRDHNKIDKEISEDDELKIIDTGAAPYTGREYREDGKKSKFNTGEVSAVLKQVDRLLSLKNPDGSYRYTPDKITLISPYKEQVRRMLIALKLKAILNDAEKGVAIDSQKADLLKANIAERVQPAARASLCAIIDTFVSQDGSPLGQAVRMKVPEIRSMFTYDLLIAPDQYRIGWNDVSMVKALFADETAASDEYNGDEGDGVSASSKEMGISTVDSIQGSENDCVIVSFVRSRINDNDGADIGFLGTFDGLCRQLVAVSRARQKLVLIGDFSRTLTKAEPPPRKAFGPDEDGYKEAVNFTTAARDKFKKMLEVYAEFQKAVKDINSPAGANLAEFSGGQAFDSVDLNINGDPENPFVIDHIKAGVAYELHEQTRAARQIDLARTYPRAPPEVEKRLNQHHVFEKIHAAKDPAFLEEVMARNSHFRPEDHGALIRIAKATPISLILGEAVIRINKNAAGEDRGVFSHVRTGRSEYKHHLKPTIWIGELQLDEMDARDIAQLLLEESQHILHKPEYRDGRWLYLDDGCGFESKNPSEVIFHDDSFRTRMTVLAYRARRVKEMLAEKAPAGANLEAKTPAGGDIEAKIQAIHSLTIEELKTHPIPSGTKILISEDLLPDDAKIALAGLKGYVEILSPEDICKAATRNSDKVSKDKVACVLTRKEFDSIWKPSHRTNNKATVLVLDNDLKDEKYLYIEAVVGLARSMMNQDAASIRAYASHLFEEPIGDDLLELLKKDNPIEFAISARLRLKPIEPVDAQKFDNYKRMVEDYLLSQA